MSGLGRGLVGGKVRIGLFLTSYILVCKRKGVILTHITTLYVYHRIGTEF